MSTLTGKDLNLVKPELTDDHKVTIGTDLPANFQKIDDEFTAHLADKAPHVVPAVKVKEATTNQSIANETYTKLTFSAEEFDTDAIFDISSPTRLTVKTAGIYRISGYCAFVFNTTGVRKILIRQSGSAILCLLNVMPVTISNTLTTMMVETTVDMAVNDYVEMEVWQNSGGALDIANTLSRAYFAMERVG